MQSWWSVNVPAELIILRVWRYLHNAIPNHCQARSVEHSPAYKVAKKIVSYQFDVIDRKHYSPGVVIVGGVTVDDDRKTTNIRQRGKFDRIKFVLT
jgi:hypothetical protein